MPDFKPTPEQDDIVEAARDTNDNLLVVARAGAAKTSTLILIAEALPDTEILCLAFNKKIAEEMTERLPSNCTAKTLHGLGYAAWNGFIQPRAKLVKNKTYLATREIIEGLQPDERQEAFDEMFDTMQIVSAAKAQGYMPDRHKGHWKPLIGTGDFYDGLPREASDLQMEIVDAVLIKSMKDALQGEIDFDDMIYCPALCAVAWPIFPLTLVDEAQDLSPINHHCLKKMVKTRRVIAVGDPLQAIYGFRGALTDSMQQLQQRFFMDELYLTVSFRCSRAVCENAHWLAPDMRYPEWAIPGAVYRRATWGAEDLKNGDAIICRNNAPLLSLAIRMIEAELLPEIAGRDLIAPLKKIMSKLGKPQAPKLAALDALQDWETKELRKAREGARGGIRDKAACIRIMLNKNDTLGNAVAYLEHLLTRNGRIHLMTGHKSKGLEFDTVYFLDQHLCQIKRDQDANIKYVIETRAKDTLHYVTSDTFEGGLTDEEAA